MILWEISTLWGLCVFRELYKQELLWFYSTYPKDLTIKIISLEKLLLVYKHQYIQLYLFPLRWVPKMSDENRIFINQTIVFSWLILSKRFCIFFSASLSETQLPNTYLSPVNPSLASSERIIK